MKNLHPVCEMMKEICESVWANGTFHFNINKDSMSYGSFGISSDDFERKLFFHHHFLKHFWNWPDKMQNEWELETVVSFNYWLNI